MKHEKCNDDSDGNDDHSDAHSSVAHRKLTAVREALHLAIRLLPEADLQLADLYFQLGLSHYNLAQTSLAQASMSGGGAHVMPSAVAESGGSAKRSLVTIARGAGRPSGSKMEAVDELKACAQAMLRSATTFQLVQGQGQYATRGQSGPNPEPGPSVTARKFARLAMQQIAAMKEST